LQNEILLMLKTYFVQDYNINNIK